MMKLLVATLALADARTLKAPQLKTSKVLALRGGMDDALVLKISAAGLAAFGTEFGSTIIGSTWASARYWNEPNPTQGWQTLSEPFGIALLVLAKQTWDVATGGGDMTGFGKNMAYGWIAWTLMHVKWYFEGKLITDGAMGLKGQLGGGTACALMAALTVKQFLL